jgi:hypothetical protein
MIYNYIENGTVGVLATQSKYPIATSDVQYELPGQTGPDLNLGVDVLLIDLNAREIYIKEDWTNRRVLENTYELYLKRGNLVQSIKFNKIFPAVVNSQAATRLALSSSTLTSELYNFIGASGSPSSLGKAYLSSFPRNLFENDTLSTFLSEERQIANLNDEIFSVKFSWTNDPSVTKNILRWRPVPIVNRFTRVNYTVVEGGTYSTFPNVSIISTWGNGESVSLQGKIVEVQVIDGGTFDGIPQVVASYPGATGASFSVSLSGNSISSVTVDNGGSGFNSGFYLGVTGATVLSEPVLYALVGLESVITLKNGYDYMEPPIVSFSGGSGAGASVSTSVTIYNEGHIDAVAVLEGGSDYVNGATLSFTGGYDASGFIVTGASGQIISTVILSGGYGFTQSTVSVTGGTGASLLPVISLYDDWNYVEVDPKVAETTVSGFKKRVDYEWQLFSQNDSFQDYNSLSSARRFKFY